MEEVAGSIPAGSTEAGIPLTETELQTMDPVAVTPKMTARESGPLWFKALLFVGGLVVAYGAVLAGLYLSVIWEPLGWIGPLVVAGVLGWVLWGRGWRALVYGIWIGAPLEFALIIWLTSQVVPNWPD